MADINEQLSTLNTSVESVITLSKEAKAAAENASTKQKEMVAQLKELNDENSKAKEWRQELEAKDKVQSEALNSLIVEVKTMRENGIMVKGQGANSMSFEGALAKGIADNYEAKVLQSSMGGKQSFFLEKGTRIPTKAASNMTTSGNLTGDPQISYIPTPFLTPRQMVNFRDLVPTVQTGTGLIAIWRENYNGGVSPEVGAFGQQLTQGDLKEQVGYDFTHVNFTANYISGFVRISKQMLQDLPFLQTYLPGMLLRDYYKYENATFYAAQVAAALGTAGSAGANDAETLINAITSLEGANFAPNGIVTTPAEWGTLIKTTFTTTPIGIVYNQSSGQIEVAGVPILKATWVAADKALVGDFTQSQIAQVDGLKVEFFEQDSDNVQRNLITVRVEARVVLVTGQPYAFITQSL